MMFDAMCGMAEKHVPDLAQKLRYASLLRIPGIHQADMGPTIPEFRMIWKAMVIEDDGGCVFIERAGQSIRPTPMRVGQSPASLTDTMRRSGTSDIGLMRGDVFSIAVAKGRAGTKVLAVFMAEFAGETPDGRVLVGAGPTKMVVVRDGAPAIVITVDVRDTRHHDLWAENQKDLFVAWTQCVMAAKPGNWILKQAPTGMERDPHKAPKIPRSHQRHKWLLISDAERARYFRAPQEAAVGDGDTVHEVAPHPRRAHYRHIGANEDGSKRYTWVRACWVGSKEAEIRGAKYRVELDL